MTIKNGFRPTAFPLVTVDPYFSIWSFDDKLSGDATRHWTGSRNAMSGFICVDGMWLRFLGNICPDNRKSFPIAELHGNYMADELTQTSYKVEATLTRYVFENEIVTLTVNFRTPLLMDDLSLMSRPVSYISFSIIYKDGKKHDTQIYFDACSEICVCDTDETVDFGITDDFIFCGKGERDVLKSDGDDILIEWGNLYLSMTGAEYEVMNNLSRIRRFVSNSETKQEITSARVSDGFPSIAVRKSYGNTDKVNDFLCIAYDDIYSMEYFGEKLKCYWAKDGETIGQVLKKAVDKYPEIMKKCDEFDTSLRKKAESISKNYGDLLALAYRQVVAAHKLSEKDGKLIFGSKECSSGGFISTVDITYPSIPLFLLYNPDLVEGMLNPIFDIVEGEHGWNYSFAPHDAGMYPKVTGQAYRWEGEDESYSESLSHMPVEECGNMILCTAALCNARNDFSYAQKHIDTLKTWADYLVNTGFDPDNQLCTDDFAGHMAHNCNLSVKAIVAIAAFGYICENAGADGSFYTKKAEEFALEWEKNAFDGDCYRLAFDRENTWSIKYNLVWDRYLNLNVFDKKLFETEVECYKRHLNTYGVPLDCRAEYGKTDWQIWSTCLTDDCEYQKSVIDAIHKFVCTTKCRTPFTDWHETKKPVSSFFRNRSAQGGIFMPLLFVR